MLCLKAEALSQEMSSSDGVIHPVNLRRSIQKVLTWIGGRRAAPSSCSSYGSASCSVVDDHTSNDGARQRTLRKLSCYRIQLEEDVQRLQQQLQEEIHLHTALAKALAYNSASLLSSSCRIPEHAQELLGHLSTLEIGVAKLEKELASLQIQLCQKGDKRRHAESHLNHLLRVSREQLAETFMCEERMSCLRLSKFGLDQNFSSLAPDLSWRYSDSDFDKNNREKILGPFSEYEEGCTQRVDESESNKNCTKINQSNNPNLLSEEMVRCMRNIFICLSESSDISSKSSSSDCFLSQSSSVDRLSSSSSFTYFSDSSLLPQLSKLPQLEDSEKDTFDPYGVNGNVNGWNIGSYRLAAEVSWMSAGKKQIEYGVEALKRYRFLVEHLAKVNPARMSENERLAFWINVYNAMMMHTYLAYGVPKSEINLFSLMKKVKASYIVGGQSFNAAEIEFIMLKMKPPMHRPQLALALAIYKFKISEKHNKYSIDRPEPLVLFALCCGMYSSPAVRVFTADNVRDELLKSMQDYVRASVGISEKGELLVPKLLHSFTRGIVEDCLLVDWICQHISPNQVTMVQDSMSRWKRGLLGDRSFDVVQFDSRFRYLFLPEASNKNQVISGCASVCFK